MPKRPTADCCAAPSRTAPLPPRERERCVAVFRALGDPTRLEVFRAIAGHGAPICVCDLTGRFDVSQPTISHHLKVLREAGLVTFERRGVWAHYRVDPRGVALACDGLGYVFRDLTPSHARAPGGSSVHAPRTRAAPPPAVGGLRPRGELESGRK